MGLVVATAFIHERAFDTFECPAEIFAPVNRDRDCQTWDLQTSDLHVPHNWAYYCPNSATVWARVYVSGDWPWFTVRNFSKRDLSGRSDWYISNWWPGSLCDPHNLELPPFVFTTKLLQRELLIHLRERKFHQ